MNKENATMKLARKPATLIALALAALLLAAAPAAAASPEWSIVSISNTNAAPGDGDPGTAEHTFLIEQRNEGDAPAKPAIEPIELHVQLPAGMEAVEIQDLRGTGWECPTVEGLHSFACSFPADFPTHSESASASLSLFALRVSLNAAASAGSEQTARFEVTGGGTAAASTADPVHVEAAEPPFGIEAFDAHAAADPAGSVASQAASRPYGLTSDIEFNTVTNPEIFKEEVWPVAAPRDVVVSSPPGLLGAPTAFDQCTVAQLANGFQIEAEAECPPGSQVGVAVIRLNAGFHDFYGPLPVFNMVPGPGEPARFGFNALNVPVFLGTRLRSESDYGVDVVSRGISQGLAFSGVSVTLWGAPSDQRHALQVACPGARAPWEMGETCSVPDRPGFLRLPTSCTAAGQGLPFDVAADSWTQPGNELPDGAPDLSDPAWVTGSVQTHLPLGFPYTPGEWGEPHGTDGCPDVPFEPSLTAQPTTNAADSPSGLDVHLSVPQGCWAPGQQDSICQSDLRDAEVKLPQGMTLNPSAAAGLGACTPAQIGLLTPVGQASPIHFDTTSAACPDNSKIGDVTIDTPLLGEPLKGAVYLAKQGENPFNSLLAMYLVAEAPERGVVVKQAGLIESDPQTGRLTTSFTEAPQTPFSDLHVELFGGPRAALRTPPSCGTYSTAGVLTPWSGNAPASVGSSFAIDKCKGGAFNPKLSAGSQNPLAGATSPFSLRISREDDEAELGGLTATLPPGLSGYLKGIPYCPDSALASVSANLGTGKAQEATPACPPASQLGTVTVGAGAGLNPFYTQSGKAYLAGPYKGAPLSLAVVTPAVAGPFDLGSVVVRNAIHIDPETAQITALSDPFPHILHGIPLDLRDIRVDLNRPEFTLNPTSCEPMQIGSLITSTQGKSADPSVHFQVAGCERLAFKPALGLRLFGKPNRGAHPALKATLAFAKTGGANLASAQVALPHSEFLDQAHIRTICTRVQFAADACPPGSIYGSARATSPIVDYTVSGPVYLRSSNHKLPDLVLALKGPASQPVEVDAVGRIDSIRGGIRTSFESTPDLPLEKVVLTMKGGKKGLIQNSRNICAHEYRATAELGAQNGQSEALRPLLRNSKCAKHRGSHAHGHRGAR